MNAHEVALARSLEFHRAVARRLRRDPSLTAKALERVRAWKGGPSGSYATEWEALLEGDFDEMIVVMTEDTERSRALRQATPFAGFIDARERWAIWRAVRERDPDAA